MGPLQVAVWTEEMNVLHTLARKAEIRIAHPTVYVRQRVADEAAALSRAGWAAAVVEQVNEALCAATARVYERDEDGSYPNVDWLTHRVRISLPWGAAGWKHSGLRQWEARILNRILR